MCRYRTGKAIDNPHYPEVIFLSRTARRMSLTSHYRDQKKRRKGLGSVGDIPVYLFFLPMSAFCCGQGQDLSLLNARF